MEEVEGDKQFAGELLEADFLDLAPLVEQTQINTIILLRIYDLLSATLTGPLSKEQAEKLRSYHENGGVVNDVKYDPEL